MVPTSNAQAKIDKILPAQSGKISIGKSIQRFAKRTFDILVASLGLLILSPWFFLVAFFIKRDSPGPVFFWCQRMGMKNRPFRMLKFRTMYERPSSYEGPPVTCKEDSRITPIGKWLRDTKINELPQLWNVLKGEMSLVGPRPEDVGIASAWPEEARSEILTVRPGITSPASILYHDEEHKINSANVMGDYLQNILPDKMRLDRLYVRNQSFAADLDIIFWTLAIFVPRIAKTKIPEGVLFSGPIFNFIHRYFNWFLIDLVISLFVVGVIGFLWRLQMPLNWGFSQLAVFACILAFLFSGVNSLAGLNRILWSQATVNDGINLLLSSSTVTLLILGVNYLQRVFNWFDFPSLPFVFILSIGLLAQIGFVVARFRLRIVTSFASRWVVWRRNSPGIGEPILIVGLEDGFNSAVWLLRREEFRYIFKIVGVVDSKFPTRLGMWVNGCLVLGSNEDIPDLVERYDIGVILFTKTDISAELKEIISKLCQNCDLRIAFFNQMIEILSQQLTQSIALPDHLLWSQDHMKFFAVYDPVSGLPNRFLFDEYLYHSLAYSHRYHTNTIVMFIRLIGITPDCEEIRPKDYSEILKQVTSRILRYKRNCDTLAYLDNHEFGLILENVQDDSAVFTIANRIHDLISAPFFVENDQVVLNSEISVCTNFGDCSKIESKRSEEIEWLLTQKRPISISERG